jgi:predicted nucleotidyltransferase
MDHSNTPQDYQEIKGRVDKEIVPVKNKLTDLRQQTSHFKVYIQKEVPMMENLVEFYRKFNSAIKKMIPGCS